MFLLNILQQADQISGYTVDSISETTEIITAQPVAQTANELSLWDLCVDGGWIMIVLAILLVIAIYIFVERSLVINKASREDGSFMKRIKDYIHDGEIASAYRLCENTDSPYSRLIAKGISRIGRPMNDVLVTIENTGNLEVANLSKGLPWLATTAAGAPMLGFLGTVIGMVQSFYAIAQSGNSAEIGSFADGIYTALVTTVAGLIVGILALFAYNYLVSRVNKVMNRMEARIMDFMDLLNEPANN